MTDRPRQSPAAASVLKRKLFNAATKGDIETLRGVLAEGADVRSLSTNKWTALHEACRYGQREAVKLLLEAGSDPNAVHASTGYTPLILATFTTGNAGTVKALLHAGALPSFAPRFGNPVMNAATTGDMEALEVLLAAAGDPQALQGPENEAAIERAGGEDLKRRIEALVVRFMTTPKQTKEEACDRPLRSA